MADIISNQRRTQGRPSGRTGAFERATEPVEAVPADAAALIPLVEMLFFAYRDFTGEADAALAAYGLGRAHHRVLHFVNRKPGIRVADLLGLLKITKQSLARVLRTLVADGWIEQEPGRDDRRERHLTLTARGRDIAGALAELQTQRIAAALGEASSLGGDGAARHVRAFLAALVAPAERALVADVVEDAAKDLDVRPKREACL